MAWVRAIRDPRPPHSMSDEITARDESGLVSQTSHADDGGDLLPCLAGAGTIGIDFHDAIGAYRGDLDPVGDGHRGRVIATYHVLEVDLVVAAAAREILNVD